MRISQAILMKIEYGESLTDEELRKAHEFYADVAESLRDLGEVFRLPCRECQQVADRLEGYLEVRAAKKEITNSIIRATHHAS